MELLLPGGNGLLRLSQVKNVGGVSESEGDLSCKAADLKTVFCNLLVMLVFASSCHELFSSLWLQA
jgi:hypothetical protein